MIIGRVNELKFLQDAVKKETSQFIAVYGRRRVGKTFLIREAYRSQLIFQHAGLYNGRRKDQLFSFCASLNDAGMTINQMPENWLQAFELLKDLIRNSKEKKKIIFIDELSWMDTPKSDLLMALEHFWNGWASGRDDIVLIICSSVTSWMINKVIHNKGGLYNRLTGRIHLEPFSLYECEKYVQEMGLAMARYQIIEAYMIIGGIPYYWGFMKKGLSLSQNIDELFFAKHAPLEDEFSYLFSSLFRYPEEYIKIVHALSLKLSGLTRNDIIEATGIAGSGAFSNKLEELEYCGFIRSFVAYGKKKKEKVYQLIDSFTIFHYHFLQKRVQDEHYWTNQLDTAKRNVWSGLAFERVCLLHINEIKKALGISGVLTDICSWSCKCNPDEGLLGSQIDLVIVRKDKVINLLEMKFSSGFYTISKSVDAELLRKRMDFVNATKTTYAIHMTMVTPYGVLPNRYFGNIQSQVTADDLFAEV